MEFRKAKRAIRRVAKKYGITEQEAVKEIENAIHSAIMESNRNEDQAVLDRWKEVPSSGAYPNAYELVEYLAEKVNNS